MLTPDDISLLKAAYESVQTTTTGWGLDNVTVGTTAGPAQVWYDGEVTVNGVTIVNLDNVTTKFAA